MTIMKKAGRPPKRVGTSLTNSLNKAGVSDVAYEIATIGIMAKEQGDLSLALKAFSELMSYQYAKKKAVDHKIDATAKMPSVNIIVSGDVSVSEDGIKQTKGLSKKKESEPIEGSFLDIDVGVPVE
jgi:hypothetical protein